jgi:hypothetical protein
MDVGADANISNPLWLVAAAGQGNTLPAIKNLNLNTLV